MRKVLAFSAVTEFLTGVALLADPSLVVRLLVGGEVAGGGLVAARAFGVALLALSIACWPDRPPAPIGGPPFRGLLVYNALIALYLAALGTVAHMEGMLLWPAAVLHAAVAVALVATRRRPSPA